MKKIYFLFITFMVCSLSFGQIIYRENMGNTNVGSNTAIASHTGWLSENQTGIVYSGTASVRTSSASSTYTGFSAGNNTFFTAAAGQTLIIDNLNTNAYSSNEILMTFGYVTTTSNAKIEIHTSLDNGTTWSTSPLTYSTVAGTAWQLANVDVGQIPQSTDLTIRFTGVTSASGMRVDDIKIERYCPVQITFGTPVATCDASTLNLDTYNLSIPYTGAGNSGLVLTTNSGVIGGDNPASIASGTITITGITEGTSYSVTATQGTCSKQVGGNSPECKPINALPYYDNFNYPVGSSLGALQTWTNMSSGADEITTISGNLSYAGITATGNSVSFAGTGSDTKLPFTVLNSGTVYYSFLMNIGSMTGVTELDGGYFAGIGESSTSLGATLWTKRVDDTNFNLGIEVRTGTAANTTYSAASYQTGQTYFVVVGYTFNTATGADDVVSLWVNPTVNAAMPTATLTDSHTGTDLLNASSFFLRQDSATETPAVQVDELRIGTAWADVVPQTAGINDNNINGLTMYPNPLSGNTLYLTSTANAAMSVQIFDLLGKEVLKATVVNNAVNVAKLTAGVYVVKITEDGKTATRKLVIK
jgi:hypothetical protein